MRAITIAKPGGPEVLVIDHRPEPAPGPDEILVAVDAAGVNRPDVMQRKGHYPPPPGASDIPGLEIAGTVVRTGASVTRWSKGDQVVALVPGGGYAEFCVVHQTNALPLPAPLTLQEGAALPETTFTVWHNVFERGRLTRGEWLLVHGGASGIGTTAIQLAKAFGAMVVATAGSDEKCRAIERLGADKAVNYKTEDFVALVRDATAGRGVEVILDMVGGDYLGRNIQAAAEDGRIVQISTLGGAVAQLDLRKLMSKRLTLTGSTLRNRPVAFKANLARAIEDQVWPLITRGLYKPVLDRMVPLEQASEAHRRLESGAHVGKLVLTVA